jgi:homospermidine synthase
LYCCYSFCDLHKNTKKSEKKEIKNTIFFEKVGKIKNIYKWVGHEKCPENFQILVGDD